MASKVGFKRVGKKLFGTQFHCLKIGEISQGFSWFSWEGLIRYSIISSNSVDYETFNVN